MRRAGSLRHLFTILRPTVTISTDTGARTKGDYTTVGTLWGELLTVSGRELEFVRGYSESSNHTISIRQGSDLKVSDRLQLGDRKFSIDAILNDETTGVDAKVIVTEVKDK